MDSLDLTLKWNNNHPDAIGWINGGDISGKVTFPDDRTYTFIYYKDEETIYWDGDKGETLNIWRSARCATDACTEIQNPSATISISGSTLTLKWNNNRPDASGRINGGDISGTVFFPDDKFYTFNYYKDEETIYWDGDKGETSNIWRNSKCEDGKKMDYADLALKWNKNRPDARGMIDCGDLSGKVNFPEDRGFPLFSDAAKNHLRGWMMIVVIMIHTLIANLN